MLLINFDIIILTAIAFLDGVSACRRVSVGVRKTRIFDIRAILRDGGSTSCYHEHAAYPKSNTKKDYSLQVKNYSDVLILCFNGILKMK